MKILILEDDPFRHKAFLRNFSVPNTIIKIVAYVSECIDFLKNEKWDMLFLDHDLDGRIYVPSDGKEPTGYHVAKFLVQNKKFMPPKIIIHSLNRHGVQKMMSLLPNALWMPHVWRAQLSQDKKGFEFLP